MEGDLMLRTIDCPVCRAAVPLTDETPGASHICPYCQTTFVLPPRGREAEAGEETD